MPFFLYYQHRYCACIVTCLVSYHTKLSGRPNHSPLVIHLRLQKMMAKLHTDIFLLEIHLQTLFINCEPGSNILGPRLYISRPRSYTSIDPDHTSRDPDHPFDDGNFNQTPVDPDRSPENVDHFSRDMLVDINYL